MRLALLLVLATLAAPAPVAAQSFFLHSGSLTARGAAIGEATTSRVSLRGGHAQVADVAFRGSTLRWRALIDLSEAHLAAGVGAATRLRGTRFEIRMQPSTWAPVLAVAPHAVRVALPLGLPVASALLDLGAAPTTTNPGELPWDSTPPTLVDEVALHCGERAPLAPYPGGTATWLPPDIAPLALASTSHGWDAIDVAVGGFLVRGYRRHDVPCEAGAIASAYGCAGVITGWSAGPNYGRVVTLPTGTRLYASATSGQAFATLRAPARGIEPFAQGGGAQADASGRIQRIPAYPTGTVRWYVLVDDPSGAHASFNAYVRLPAETLPDAPPGGCTDPTLARPDARDWPPLPD